MIKTIEQWKAPNGKWLVMITHDDDCRPYSRGPRIWWETDGTGEAGLTRMFEGELRMQQYERERIIDNLLEELQ